MTVEQLTLIAASALSLLAHFWPRYNGLPSHQKALIMAGLLLLVAGGAFAFSCTSLGEYFTCSDLGAWAAVRLFVEALMANQATYFITRDVAAQVVERRAKS